MAQRRHSDRDTDCDTDTDTLKQVHKAQLMKKKNGELTLFFKTKILVFQKLDWVCSGRIELEWVDMSVLD